MFKIGDIVKYRWGYKTEYEIIDVYSNNYKFLGNRTFAELKLTKLDPKRLTNKSKIGAVFKGVETEQLEKIKSRGHHLTTIFK